MKTIKEGKKMRILMVEDDEQIREVVKDYFENHAKQYEIDYAVNGPEGLKMLREGNYDLLLLDVMLPGMSGFSILREIRKINLAENRERIKRHDIPVIMMTAKIREEDRLLGYELGCDDYVCKPFSIAELCAKVNAVLRRVKVRSGTNVEAGSEEEKCLSHNGICINLRTNEVTVNGRNVSLSPKEYELLLAFMEHPNWLFTRETLLNRIWGMDYEGTERTVDNHVKKLRKNLGAAGRQIKTVFGKGYKLTGEER